jgi:hypothetical protein
MVTVYAMKTVHEKLFGGMQKRSDMEMVVDQLIQRCTNLPKELTPEDLYVGDRVFLMINIRAASYGVKYTFTAQCPNCNAKAPFEVNLLEGLEVQELQDDWSDPFTITLPYNKDTVTMRLFRGREERRVIQFVESQQKRGNLSQMGDPAYVYRIALHIISVESADVKRIINPGSPRDIMAQCIQYVENLDAPDSSAIREEIDQRTPGIILSVNLDCRSCAHNWDTSMPMSADFFRSKARSGGYTAARVVSSNEW